MQRKTKQIDCLFCGKAIAELLIYEETGKNRVQFLCHCGLKTPIMEVGSFGYGPAIRLDEQYTDGFIEVTKIRKVSGSNPILIEVDKND